MGKKGGGQGLWHAYSYLNLSALLKPSVWCKLPIAHMNNFNLQDFSTDGKRAETMANMGANELMDGWMYKWMGGWMDAWMDSPSPNSKYLQTSPLLFVCVTPLPKALEVNILLRKAPHRGSTLVTKISGDGQVFFPAKLVSPLICSLVLHFVDLHEWIWG